MEEVFNYLIDRQAYNFEPLKFGFWKRIIKYKVNTDNYHIRKIFNELLQEGYFSKIRINNKHFKYQFIPYGENPKSLFPIIINF
tara:strand:+ start:799 stop:1050 length:252 start_codon:yes stop_codon:yes gene_type:complete